MYQFVDDNGTIINLDDDQIKAFELIKNNTKKVVYITGKAGTGKTTLLKFIRNNIGKQTAVVTPTGVAAINAKGQTLHTFFKILPQNLPYLPDDNRLRFTAPIGDIDRTTIKSHFEYTPVRREVMENLELLIIDEVSMVRADLLDVIDKLLRAYSGRGRHKPFGGVQVLLIGDPFQLAPIEGADWGFLSPFYTSPFFFSSKIFQESSPLRIELKTIHRQEEQVFISLLNRIRVNQVTGEDIIDLNNKVQPLTDEHFDQKFIVLCSTKPQANLINSSRLNSIEGAERTYVGEIDGDFPDPVTDINLCLKVGAQIMFLRNTQNYSNGTIGKVVELNDNGIVASTLNMQGVEMLFTVEKAIWHNVKYLFNPNTNRIEQEIIGTFTQYPIKLAWAINVHKSQGLTFEKVIVDINHFAPSGLAYVAFSRCTTLNGLLLRTAIAPHQINVDPRVVEFAKNVTPDTLIVDAINGGKADQLYKEARISIAKGDFEQAISIFLKAIKYRNDVETDQFKKYVLVQLNRISHYRALFDSSNIKRKELHSKLNEAEQETFELLNKYDQIENANIDMEVELDVERAVNSKQKKEMEEWKFKFEWSKEYYQNEIDRLKKLSWLDKLLGKK